MTLEISVIVPAHNAERFLLETLESIAAQTHPDFEVIVVDDASTDRTRAIAEAFAERDERVRVLHLSENVGLAEARNRGIEHATGRWMALCDADDLWAPDKLAQQVRFIEEWVPVDEPLVGLGTWGYRINAASERIDRALPRELDTVEDFRTRRDAGLPIVTGASSLLIDKDVWDRAGRFRAEFRQAEDLDMWARMAEHGLILNLPELLSSYRIHGGSLTDKGFVEQRINIQRIVHNTARRRAGEPEHSYDEYIAHQRANQPEEFAAQLKRWRNEAQFRRIGAAATNGQKGRALLLSAALAVRSPSVLWRGLSGYLRRRAR